MSWPRRHGFRLAAVALALLVTSCSLLPGMQPEATGEDRPKGEAGAAPAPAKAPMAAATPPAPTSVVDEPRMFPGSGYFVNTEPKEPEKKAGPEEASLNFEALDIRAAAKVILGDYLRESYTVHPGVTGTVAFRTIKPIPKSALLPTLEMLLRQNNAAVVKEDGIFKVVPIAAVRGSISPQLGGAAVPLPQGYSVLVVPVKYVGVKKLKEIYAKTFGKDAEVVAIHAGLECGIIGEKFPGMDMISFRPTMKNPHSPEEHVHIGSVEKFWKSLTAAIDGLSS